MSELALKDNEAYFDTKGKGAEPNNGQLDNKRRKPLYLQKSKYLKEKKKTSLTNFLTVELIRETQF